MSRFSGLNTSFRRKSRQFRSGSSSIAHCSISPAQLVLYWLVAAITAPIFEEIIFRGFIQQGWSESRIGVIAALLLSTLLFVQAHTQYDLRGLLDVFAIGLALGLTRWWSGSTLLAIMMHAGWNFTNSFIIALMAWTNG